jgi:hypothetical protein
MLNSRRFPMVDTGDPRIMKNLPTFDPEPMAQVDIFGSDQRFVKTLYFQKFFPSNK